MTEAHQYDRAQEIGKKILEAGLTATTAQYVLICGLLFRQGQYEQAVALLQKGISLAPTRTESQAALAGTYARMAKRMRRGRFSGGCKGLPPTQFVFANVCAASNVLSGIRTMHPMAGEGDDQHDASVSDMLVCRSWISSR